MSKMAACLLISGIMAIMANGAEIPAPSQFHIVSASFSDNGGLFYYRVLEVTPDGADAWSVTREFLL